MMNTRTRLFIVLAFSSIFLQTACTKKVTSVGGRANLAERKRLIESQSPSQGGSLGRDEGGMLVPDEASGISSDPIKEEALEKKEALTETDRNEVSAALSDVFFDYDKSSLKSASKSALQENARYLILNPSVHVQIEGHTDERGSNAYNLALGARRARAVKRFLDALGVSPDRMTNISYGEEKPSCQKSQKSCWKRNRRVHFQPQAKD